MRTRDIDRLEELERMAREIQRGLERQAYQRPPFLDVTLKEAKIASKRLLEFIEEAVWLAKNPL